MAKASVRERLDAIRQQQSKKSAPSLHPRGTDKVLEEQIYDVRELGLDAHDSNELLRLTAEYAKCSHIASEANRDRTVIGTKLKRMCNDYGLKRVKADDLTLSYYETVRTKVDVALLRAHGVSAATIAACTIKTPSMALRVSAPGQREDNHDD